MDPFEFLGITDPVDSMLGQVILQNAEKQHDKALESLAVKIRNQIAEMMK